MSSGIQGAVNGAATLTYTPGSTGKAKLLISNGSAGPLVITINASSFTAAVGLSTIDIYVAEGVPLVVTSVASVTIMVSSLEE